MPYTQVNDRLNEAGVTPEYRPRRDRTYQPVDPRVEAEPERDYRRGFMEREAPPTLERRRAITKGLRALHKAGTIRRIRIIGPGQFRVFTATQIDVWAATGRWEALDSTARGLSWGSFLTYIGSAERMGDNDLEQVRAA